MNKEEDSKSRGEASQVSKRRRKKKSTAESEDSSKMEQEYSPSSEKKSKGRPKKDPEISSQSAKAELKVKKGKEGSKAEKAEKDSAKLQESVASVSTRKRKSAKSTKSAKSQRLDAPNQHDLCEALMLLRTKLPNRSLEKIIIRLYQLVEEKVKNKESIFSRSQVDSRTRRDFQSVCSDKQARNEEEMEGSQRLAVPGRKVSVYHDKAGSAAALSHQYYKNNAPTLENIEMMERSMTHSAFLPKKHADSSIKMEEEINSGEDKLFHFKKADCLRKNFSNPQEAARYKQRRELTDLFITRGYGITKAIDSDLPKISIQRDKYKNLLGGVLTSAFRKLQSFITHQCRRTIKFLDRQQMKSTSYMLLNCRLKLEPSVCESFFKFLQIGYGLADISISQSEAVELYVGIMKHLYGQGITMENLQHMGRIKNRRDMESTLSSLKQKAEYNHSKHKGEGENRLQQDDVGFTQSEWTLNCDYQLANLYVKCKDVEASRKQMIKKYPKLKHLTVQYFTEKLERMIDQGLDKIRIQNQIHLPSGPFLLKLQPNYVQYIKNEPEGDQIRTLILSYLFSNEHSLLERFIEEINQFVEAAGDLKTAYETLQTLDEQEMLLDHHNDPQFLNYQPILDEYDIDPSLIDNLQEAETVAFS